MNPHWGMRMMGTPNQLVEMGGEPIRSPQIVQEEMTEEMKLRFSNQF